LVYRKACAEKFNHLSPFPHGRFDEIAKTIDNSSGIDRVWAKRQRIIFRWIKLFQRNLEKSGGLPVIILKHATQTAAAGKHGFIYGWS
jgi:hypothetical protein